VEGAQGGRREAKSYSVNGVESAPAPQAGRRCAVPDGISMGGTLAMTDLRSRSTASTSPAVVFRGIVRLGVQTPSLQIRVQSCRGAAGGPVTSRRRRQRDRWQVPAAALVGRTAPFPNYALIFPATSDVLSAKGTVPEAGRFDVNAGSWPPPARS